MNNGILSYQLEVSRPIEIKFGDASVLINPGDQTNAEILRLRTQLIRFAELVYISRNGTPTEAEAQELVAIEGIWFGIHPEPNHPSNLAPSNVELE